MKNFYNFSLNKSWVFHFTLAVIHDFALYCLIIPIKNGIINASKNFMCAWVCMQINIILWTPSHPKVEQWPQVGGLIARVGLDLEGF